MTDLTSMLPTLTIGFDIGDRHSHAVAIDGNGDTSRTQRVPTTKKGLETWYGPKSRLTGGQPCRVIIEAATHSAWVGEVLTTLGHDVIVANPRKMVRIGGRRRRKNDKIDAEGLARVGRLDPALLAPIRHRGREAREDLTVIRARNEAVACRTSLISCVRAHVKANGHRLKSCSTASFHKRAADQIPEGLRPALQPLLTLIENVTTVVRDFDRQIDELATRKHRESQCLTQVGGIGNLTALTYVLTLENHQRFQRSRCVGAFLGLVPHQHQSGDNDPPLRISKTGDVMLRRLLVTAAHYILGPLNKKDSGLRRFGTRLIARGGPTAKKKAVVAVARKLAVVLHSLWRTGEVYEPLRSCPEPHPAT